MSSSCEGLLYNFHSIEFLIPTIDQLGTRFSSSSGLGAIYGGLRLAWDADIRNLLFESYNKLVNMLNSSGYQRNNFSLVCTINELNNREPTITISHVLKEANVAVNSLTKYGLENDYYVHIMERPSVSISVSSE
ncbi:hypothetical protein PVK06_012150 [Gossypium arboreum]|uniref:RNase H type-1 domain-containing protein n=1 Tax=Gossypium arboreum TaxID=29729 RepID=A0ABR0QAL0_GOSAR|nr:hypothetical protein PVK06_012150 [Gossypium arboreum]